MSVRQSSVLVLLSLFLALPLFGLDQDAIPDNVKKDVNEFIALKKLTVVCHLPVRIVQHKDTKALADAVNEGREYIMRGKQLIKLETMVEVTEEEAIIHFGTTQMEKVWHCYFQLRVWPRGWGREAEKWIALSEEFKKWLAEKQEKGGGQ